MTTTTHHLIGAGAAHDKDGDRLFSNTTSGVGSALCSCGWLSDQVEFGRQRKALHKEHVAEMSELIEVDDELIEDDELDSMIEEIDAIVAAVDAEPVGDETTAPQPENAPLRKFPVRWPESVAKLFFRALAKDGARIIAEAYELGRDSNETRLDLQIVGRDGLSMVAMDLAESLPSVFVAANESLRQWRKTSLDYKEFDLKTGPGRRDAFAAEQNYLRDFCRAAAGVWPPDSLGNPGLQAGLVFVNGGEVL